MRTVEKACAGVVRPGQGGPELLVFDHPLAGTSLPTGTVAAGERPDEAVVRELAEETGLTAAAVEASIGVWTRVAGAGPQGRGGPERHAWHVFLLRPTGPVASRWTHAMAGSDEGQRHIVTCRWVPLDGTVWMRVQPLFTPVLDMLVAAVRRRR